MLSDYELINRLSQAQVRHLVHQDDKQWVLFEDHDYLWLTLDTVVQSIMSKTEPSKLMLGYHHALLPHLPHHFESIIELGLGGGSLIRYLCDRQPDLKYTCIEQSQQVIDWFNDYFNPSQCQVKVLAADACAAITELAPADVMLCDLFSDFGSPAFLFDPAFYQACASKFSDTLIINLLPRQQDELDAVILLVTQQFKQTPQVIKVENMRNHLIVINKEKPHNIEKN
ncbi:hypothetical protein Q4519_10545 [Motilimonas sp. 1_MG-2023]|uniref:spermidine synthase n=1 Tax=Motilimonas sp. 1_MG-2023 TaxID=3062672 RepID=UPI0026E49353|nr:hypothetical protein [Motilimonas sp. 1_MG-2023]MDO6526120.1 hypothetical protein [Motilimonas sp. 1_MG-2023]